MSGGGGEGPRTLVIVNPASAGGRTGRRWPDFRDAMFRAAVEHQTFLTSGPGDATTATRRALADGYDRIVSCGGDGTLNEVVNGFFTPDGSPVNRDAILGLLPSGSGSDFRRSTRLPTEPAALATILARNRTRRIDAGRIVFDSPATPPRHFVNIADCGVGGEVVARVNRGAGKRGGVGGTLVFLAVSLRVLATFASRPVRLTTDGVAIEVRIQNVVIANGSCFGGGMRIAPGAAMDDGVFDVVVLPAMGRLSTLMAVPSVYLGAHLRRPGVRVIRARVVRVEPLDPRPLLFDIEGEQIGAAPATLTCLPGALRLCAG